MSTSSSLDLSYYIHDDHFDQHIRHLACSIKEINHDTFPELNPNSPKFNSKLWVLNLKHLYESDPFYFKHTSLGAAFKNLKVYGMFRNVDYAPTVLSACFKPIIDLINNIIHRKEERYVEIVKSLDLLLKPGETTLVLGKPGSGCSTLLKTIALNTYGLKINNEARISYDGYNAKEIESSLRSDVIYLSEFESYYPNMSVKEFLEFVAKFKTPQNRGNINRDIYAAHMANVYMATFRLLHVRNVNIGDEYVQGISAGERKRVGIAEVCLCDPKIQCWNKPTRGLDAATALEFIKAVQIGAKILNKTPLISIYQCSEDAIRLFDNILLMYQGFQIYYGPVIKARDFFIDMGYFCPERQTTAEFLTSLTNPLERRALPGFELKVPRTPLEFSRYWKNSQQYKILIGEIDDYFRKGMNFLLHESHVLTQSRHLSSSSPYTISFFMQVRYLITYNFINMKKDPSSVLFIIFGQIVIALVVSSVYYNLEDSTSSIFERQAAMFFAVLYNAFTSLLEIMLLFEARIIIEKHRKYALYKPLAHTVASLITWLPVQLIATTAFNLIFYFMVNFRREPGRFFFFWLMMFMSTLIMSNLFRSIGVVTSSLTSAMTPATILLLAVIIYTGFVVPRPMVRGWAKWILYINPLAYIFESLMVNEFDGRFLNCTNLVPRGPGYEFVPSQYQVCANPGSEPGESFVNGTQWLELSYHFSNKHKWRNFGISLAFAIGFFILYVCLTALLKPKAKREIALFLKGRRNLRKQADINRETPKSDYSSETSFNSDKNIFHWRDLTYSIKDKQILDHVDGWVRPGEITALVGVTGSGKTTLLNCLSERNTFGKITEGSRMVDGGPLPISFPRSIGYAQQEDLHLSKSTVREALQFSAYLRQPKHVTKKDKAAYVEHIIDLLDLTDYADAIVGIPGEGLNVEQRKKVTIGVELAAKPSVLLFVDEPTSGLDTQTAWSICKLLRKLANQGHAILCAIHQPSALMMNEFDRVLFLTNGGKTVYFGDLGRNCSTLINYFERHSNYRCPRDANPADWILKVAGAAPGSHVTKDFFEVWRNSDEFHQMQQQLQTFEQMSRFPHNDSSKYATSLWTQYYLVTKRVFYQDWRSPGYIYSKLGLVVFSSLFIGFSFFKYPDTVKGMQNQMFAIFISFVPFQTLIQQMLPMYVNHRNLYEAREASSRIYSWFAFISAQITSEIPFQIILGTLAYFCWYYPVGLNHNTIMAHQTHSRGVLMWLLLVSFYIYIPTVGQICILFFKSKQNAANLATILFSLWLVFCGVLDPPSSLPRFWIFMYKVNPFTYLVQAILATGLANTEITCAPHEYVELNYPKNTTCQAYMQQYLNNFRGYIIEQNGACKYCPYNWSNQYLDTINADYNKRWINLGIFIGFIVFNIFATIFLFWLLRVPRRKKWIIV